MERRAELCGDSWELAWARYTQLNVVCLAFGCVLKVDEWWKKQEKACLSSRAAHALIRWTRAEDLKDLYESQKQWTKFSDVIIHWSIIFSSCDLNNVIREDKGRENTLDRSQSITQTTRSPSDNSHLQSIKRQMFMDCARTQRKQPRLTVSVSNKAYLTARNWDQTTDFPTHGQFKTIWTK